MRDDRASATAYLIARSTYFLSRDPLLGRFVTKRAAELSRWFVETRRQFGRRLDPIAYSKTLRPLNRALERATIPGIKLHYALRKRFLEEIAREALANGIRQVVVIGAGFDTLALRLHEEFTEVEFFEVDHPATQREKKRVIATHQPTRRNLHFVALDLAHRNLEGSLLAQEDYQRGAETLFIAEGLLMYLAPAEIDLILEFVRQHSGPKSKFAFTFMETQSNGRIGFRRSSRLVDAWLRLRGESFKWGMARASIPDFLAARGFDVLGIAASETLREKYLTSAQLADLPLADGECICTAAPVAKG
ncbi:MAG TPA: SAM-dependent methyltransferase [Pyrinomonadaceae bacterium]